MSDVTFDKGSGFKTYSPDAKIEAAIAEHCQKFGITPADAVKLFPILARRQSPKRFLAHVELFKMTLGVPGDIAELGVFRGLGLMTWANLLEAYCIGDRTKTVIGFDNWTGFSGFSPEDGKQVEAAGKSTAGFDASAFKAELEAAIAIYDADRFVPWKGRIRLVEGQIEETVAKHLTDNPGIRFSLVHFDCDLYAPTKAALAAIWPRVTRGGVVIFDEYSIHDWSGETKAVDEFLETQPGLRLRKFDWTNAPASWLVKS